MKPVFDASALLNIVRLLGPKAYDYLKGGFILTLTPYEVGNALWKETTLLSRITINEALTLLDLMEGIYRVLNVVFPRDALLALRVAHVLRITYYDSSYIVASYELGTGLVTDDGRLRRKVEEGREALTEILGREVKLYSTKEITGRKEKP